MPPGVEVSVIDREQRGMEVRAADYRAGVQMSTVLTVGALENFQDSTRRLARQMAEAVRRVTDGTARLEVALAGDPMAGFAVSTAEATAAALLKERLDDVQRRDLLESGAFNVRGSDGRWYRVTDADVYHVVDDRGIAWCATPIDEDVPRSDRNHGTMLMLQSDVGLYMNVANRGGWLPQRPAGPEGTVASPPNPSAGAPALADCPCEECRRRQRYAVSDPF